MGCEANIKSVYLESDTYKSFMERKTLRQYMTASIVERLRSQALVTMYDLQLDLLHEMCGVYVSMADSKADVSALERAAFLERGTALQKQQEKALAEYYTGLSVSTAIFRPEFDFTNHWQAYEVLANRAEVFVDTSDGAAPVGLQDLAASSDKGTGKKKKKTPKLTSKVAKKVAKKELKRRHSSVLLTADEVFGIIEGASRGAQDDSRRASSSSGVFSDADQGSDSDASESTTNSYMKKSSSAMKEGFPALEESPLEQRGTSDAAVPGADGSDDDDDAEYGFDPLAAEPSALLRFTRTATHTRHTHTHTHNCFKPACIVFRAVLSSSVSVARSSWVFVFSLPFFPTRLIEKCHCS